MWLPFSLSQLQLGSSEAGAGKKGTTFHKPLRNRVPSDMRAAIARGRDIAKRPLLISWLAFWAPCFNRHLS